jgi:hypothetical protein
MVCKEVPAFAGMSRHLFIERRKKGLPGGSPFFLLLP